MRKARRERQIVDVQPQTEKAAEAAALIDRQRTMSCVFRGAFLATAWLTCVPLVLFGGYLLWEQRSKVNCCRPVPATLTDHEARSVGEGYEYRVTYRYRVDGQEYISENLFPIRWSAETPDPDWWQGLRNGMTVTAYYDPDQPSRAFLVTHDIFPPCVFMLVGTATLIWFTLIFGVVGASLHRRNKRRATLAGAIVWQAVGIGVIVYYYSTLGTADVSVHGGRLIVMLVYELVGLSLLIGGLSLTAESATNRSS